MLFQSWVKFFWLSIAGAMWFALWAFCATRTQAAQNDNDIVAMYLFRGLDEAAYKQHLESHTELRIERIAEVTGLEADQLNKLKLAAKGDLNRFYRDLAIVQKRTQGLDPQQQADMQKAWEEIMPLYHKVEGGLLEEKSLFKKVLQGTLDEQQMEAYKAYLKQRRLAKTRAIVSITVAEVERSHSPA